MNLGAEGITGKARLGTTNTQCCARSHSEVNLASKQTRPCAAESLSASPYSACIWEEGEGWVGREGWGRWRVGGWVGAAGASLLIRALLPARELTLLWLNDLK